MAGKDGLKSEEYQKKLTEYEKKDDQYREDWELKNTRYQQGIWLAIRRTLRFTSYQVFKNTPTTKYEKVFTPAYLPFTMRNNTALIGLLAVGYLSYLGLYKSRHGVTK
jgi:hypothetical protein